MKSVSTAIRTPSRAARSPSSRRSDRSSAGSRSSSAAGRAGTTPGWWTITVAPTAAVSSSMARATRSWWARFGSSIRVSGSTPGAGGQRRRRARAASSRRAMSGRTRPPETSWAANSGSSQWEMPASSIRASVSSTSERSGRRPPAVKPTPAIGGWSVKAWSPAAGAGSAAEAVEALLDHGVVGLVRPEAGEDPAPALAGLVLPPLLECADAEEPLRLRVVRGGGGGAGVELRGVVAHPRQGVGRGRRPEQEGGLGLEQAGVVRVQSEAALVGGAGLVGLAQDEAGLAEPEPADGVAAVGVELRLELADHAADELAPLLRRHGVAATGRGLVGCRRDRGP